jgi:hypothetical protein
MRKTTPKKAKAKTPTPERIQQLYDESVRLFQAHERANWLRDEQRALVAFWQRQWRLACRKLLVQQGAALETETGERLVWEYRAPMIEVLDETVERARQRVVDATDASLEYEQEAERAHRAWLRALDRLEEAKREAKDEAEAPSRKLDS